MSYAMEMGPRPHLITVDEYHRMAEVGLLAPDARVELIEGVIIDMAPIGPLHGHVVDTLTKSLVLGVGDQAIVRTQGAVRLSRLSEPHPDVTLLKPRPGGYPDKQPVGRDTLLIVEVSHSSARDDRKTKVPLYARYGVPEVWLIDLAARELCLFRARTDLGYADVVCTSDPRLVEVRSLAGVSVNLTGVFGFT